MKVKKKRRLIDTPDTRELRKKGLKQTADFLMWYHAECIKSDFGMFPSRKMTFLSKIMMAIAYDKPIHYRGEETKWFIHGKQEEFFGNLLQKLNPPKTGIPTAFGKSGENM